MFYQPDVASASGKESTDCSSQPDVASVSGKESTDCSSQPDVASAPGKESTDCSSQPDVASAPGKESTDCSSQPDVASAPGKESTYCSSQPYVASAPGNESTVGTLPQTCCTRSNETNPKHDKKKHKKLCPKQWTSHDKEDIRLHVASAIMLKRLPGRNMIVKFLEETGINRSWKKVKDHIRNTHLARKSHRL